MKTTAILATFSLALAPLAQALSDYDALLVVHQLAESFLSPKNVEVANSINSTLFTDDVKGTLDLSTNFDGRELSTEYLFGLFVNSDAKGKPTPWGTPVAYNVTHFIVQNDIVATSIKFTFHWPTIDKYWPIQIDSFLRVTESNQISAYDVSFRRWAWATEQFMPALVPQMAEAVNMSPVNETAVVWRYFAEQICETAQTNCNGTHQQYDSHGQCLDYLLNEIPLGEFHMLGGNNVLCRMLHVPMLPLRPSVHCDHVGPSGGDMCIKRDYNQVVMDSHFPEGWLAPKQVTTQNAYIVGDTTFTNGTEVSPLLEISMSKTNSWDPTWYATSTLVLFLILYTLASGIWFCMFRYNRVFPTLCLDHQKNVVVYFLNTFIMTVALGLQMRTLPALKEDYTFDELRALRASGMLVSAVYLFEMLYRLSMRIPLLTHHFLTIFAMSFTVTMAEYTKAPDFIASAIIWLFQATTEQIVFVGLAGYRLGWPQKHVSRMLKIGAILTLIIKSASAVGLLVWWGLRQNRTDHAIDIAWTVILFITAIGLMVTQVWGSWVTYAIGLKVDRRSTLPQNGVFDHSNLSVFAATPASLEKGTPTSPEGGSLATLNYHQPGVVLRAPSILPRPSMASSRGNDAMQTAPSSPVLSTRSQDRREEIDKKD